MSKSAARRGRPLAAASVMPASSCENDGVTLTASAGAKEGTSVLTAARE